MTQLTLEDAAHNDTVNIGGLESQAQLRRTGRHTTQLTQWKTLEDIRTTVKVLEDHNNTVKLEDVQKTTMTS